MPTPPAALAKHILSSYYETTYRPTDRVRTAELRAYLKRNYPEWKTMPTDFFEILFDALGLGATGDDPRCRVGIRPHPWVKKAKETGNTLASPL